ncbi:MAG: hypothetical protein EHM93_03260 [Bacteroidales bacterium]|nr:MAG: hypothetical protein EHM93_03260 [Bacteroidales bacterium]
MRIRKLRLQLYKVLATLKFLLAIVVIVNITQCQKISRLANKKVIVTPLGELNEITKYPGETVTFRIYYVNTQSKITDVNIIDTIHPLLKNVELLNEGKYLKGSGLPVKNERIAVWIIPNVDPKKGGYIEFTGEVSDNSSSAISRIVNRAHISFSKSGLVKPLPVGVKTPEIDIKNIKDLRSISTNKVIVNICCNPTLGWIPFKPHAEKDDKPFYALKDETTMGILVNFEFPGMYVQERVIEETIYHSLTIPTLSSVNDEGKPAIPVAGKLIEIPKDASFTIEIFKSDSVNLSCYNLIPFQELTVEPSSDSPSKFKIDPKIYAKNASYPGKLAGVEVEDMGIMRGHRLIFLKVYPIQFNPVKKSLTAYSQIEVRVKYAKPVQIEPIPKRLYSAGFEEILESSVLNYNFDRVVEQMENNAEDDNGDKRYGCDYLIITEDAFYDATDAANPVNRLAHWKTRKGLMVEVVNISTIGNTAASIRTYMENMYINWTRVPQYVVFIGDANHITPDYRTIHTGHTVTVGGADVTTQVGTDLYYTTLDGADYFPDIMLSRISVDNVNQLGAVIDKSILYEQNPPALAAYYNTTSLVRLFEDDTDPVPAGSPADACPSDDMEDCGWVLIERAEEMRDYLIGEGYDAQRVYNFSGGIAGGPQRWENGTNLPDQLTQQPPVVFQWNGVAANIQNAFNNGNFLITYRGHGGRDGWGRPNFHIANIAALNQNDMPAFVFGVTCQTGWFDDETDNAVLNTNTDCFAEELLRAQRRGAIGIVASSRNSWGSCNNPITEGLCDALWPDFDNTINGGFLPRLGQLFVYSKTYLAQNVGATNGRLITFEMTHLFGDPELPVWVSEPGEMNVSHPEGIGSTGKQEIVIKVTDKNTGVPVASAVVALTRDLTILGGVQTDAGGNARILLENVGAGDIDVTVTSKFYRPYMGIIRANNGGAYINVLNPENGISNQTIYLGGKDFSGSEEVKIYFDGTHVKTTNAVSGEFGQSNDLTFDVPNGKPLGLYNVVAIGSTSGRYAVEVFQVRDERIVDLYTYSQWDESTWSLEPNNELVWNSPEIWLKDGGGTTVASNNLVLGTNYEINAKVYNNQNNPANAVRVTFKWAQHGIGQVVWDDIETVPIVVPENGNATATANWTPSVSGHVCIKAEIYHIEDINPANNMGQENCHVGPTSSPAEVKFTLCNPTDKPAMVFLKVYQHKTKGNEGKTRSLWGSFIKHPDPQLLKPGECREISVIVDPDFSVDKVSKGEVAKFTVSGYINRKLIGGIDLEVVKK